MNCVLVGGRGRRPDFVAAARALTHSLHIINSRSAMSLSVGIDEFRRVFVAWRIDDQLAHYCRQEARARPLFVRARRGEVARIESDSN